jgi:hypothetical protein
MKKKTSIAWIAGASMVLFLWYPAAWAQGCWTAVGSTGVVDESSASTAWFFRPGPSGVLRNFGSDVGIRPSAPLPASAMLYYNVVDEEGIHNNQVPFMRLLYTDNDALGAQVIAQLKEVNQTTGAVFIIAEFDSDSPGNLQSPDLQIANVPVDRDLDFSTSAYYIELLLLKNNSSGNPTVRVLSICSGVL